MADRTNDAVASGAGTSPIIQAEVSLDTVGVEQIAKALAESDAGVIAVLKGFIDGQGQFE